MKTFQLSKQTSLTNKSFYRLKPFDGLRGYVLFLIKIVFFILPPLLSVMTVFSQSQSLQLLPHAETKVARLAQDAQTAQVSFVVDGGTKVKVHLRSNASDVSVNVACPNGQTVNSGNISGINGTFNSYEIGQQQSGIIPGSDFMVGFHYVFEFPNQGIGSYNISFAAQSSMNQEIVVIADLSTDSTINSRLFTTPTSVIAGKPIVLSLALFDEQTAVTGATITAEILLPNGTSVNKTFSDDGTGVDYQAGDGLYNSYYIPTQPGDYTVSAQINGTKSPNTPYNLSAFSKFSVTPFVGRLTGVVEDYGADDDSDGLLDRVVLRTGVETAEAGNFGVFVHLRTNNGKYLIRNSRTQLNTAGINHLDLNFDAKSFVDLRENGPYFIDLIELVKYGQESFTQIHSLQNQGQTQAYQISQFQRPPIIFTNSNQFEGLDFNNNGKFDVLNIKVGLNVIKSGAYLVGGTLYDSNDKRIDGFYSRINLVAGDNYVPFTFNGGKINQHGMSGIYKLKNVFIREFKETDTGVFTGSAISVSNLLETPSYNINQFEGQETPLGFTGNHVSIGIDVNSNGKFDFLRIQSTLYAASSGTYNISFNLKDSAGNILQAAGFSQRLESGFNLVQFDFDGGPIANAGINGPLTISDVAVSGQGGSLQLPLLFITQPFNSNQFEDGLEFVGGYSATGIDTNSDGKFNLLRIQGNVAVGIAGSYDVSIYLRDSNGNYITGVGSYFNFSSGVNTFTLNLEGNPIYLSGINGPYQISAYVSGQGRTLQNQNLFQTPAFNYTDFEMTFGFTGVNSAVAIDTNANGKFETLRINTNLKVPSQSSYSQISASLIDSNGQIIESVSGNYDLVAGINNIRFDFNGVRINNNGVDGPYRIGNVSVSSYAGSISVPNLFTTQFFAANQFEGGQVNLQYATYRLVPVSGDGDGFLEPGETAQLYVSLINPGTGGARNISAVLSSDSSAIEISNGNGTYSNISPSTEKESSPFLIRLKPESQYGTDVSFVLNLTYNDGESKTFNFSVQSGKLKKIIYVKYAENKSQIFSMYSDGSAKVNLSDSGYLDANPLPSPDGSKIVFIRLINNSTREFWIMNNDGSNQQRLTGLNRFSFLSLKWSPDSTKIVFLNRVSNIYDLYVINSDGTGLIRLTNNSDWEDYISWSPNGNKIAYTKNGEVHVINPDGTGDTVIHSEDYQYDIEWSPDGAWLGWINGRDDVQTRKYYRDIYVSKLDGSEKKLVTQGADARIMSWSPDSTQIAYVNVQEESRQRDIFSVNVLNSQSVDLTKFVYTDNYYFDIDDSDSGIEWSPDGKKIAFAADERIYSPTFFARESVFILDVNKLNLMRLTDGGDRTYSYNPNWRAETVSADNTAPNSLALISPNSNSAGWNKDNVVVTINSTDNENGSGVKEITYSASGSQTIPNVVVTGSAANLQITAEGNALVNYFAKDNAGNMETVKSLPVKIDKTAPVTIGNYVLNGIQATVTLTSSDSLSGVAATYYSLDNGGIQNYSAPFTVGGNGTHTVTYYASDFAENTEAVKMLTFNIDATAPTSSATTTSVNAAGWSKDNVTVNVNSIDNTNGTGVKDIMYSASGAQTISATAISGNSASFQITAEGITTVTYYAVDNAGNVETNKTLMVKVDKTPPTTSGIYTLNGQQAVVSLTSTDGNSEIGDIKYSVDGGATQSYTAPLTVLGSGNHTINYFAIDNAGNIEAIKSLGFNIPIINPLVNISGPQSGSIFPVGAIVAFTGNFTNDQCNTHNALWKFNNISQTGTINESNRMVNANYTFTSTGVYFVTLTINNTCGGTGTADKVNDLTAMVVIYDPNGSFITGGGWIDSPLGAFPANPNLVGKVSFGLNSKYHNGATIPTGNTEVQFNIANFNFKSTSYDWLVISNEKAQYKGSGTVNGTGSYGFILTTIDGKINGGEDKFRIKVWNKTNGNVIYDNQIGESDNASPNTVIGGGSIVIHK